MHLHIISFDIPFPANYGGVIDVYYKLVWLHKLGVKIHLHCFEYGREHSKELEKVCEKVYYYDRKTHLASLLSIVPYTVQSRISKKLRKRLLKDDSPILCEVLHTCYILKDAAFAKRFKIYRHSNIEHEYYQGLAKVEKNFFKRLYLKTEAWKLKRFEKIVVHANLILAVNQNDANYYRKQFPKVKTEYLPSFHSNGEVNIKPGSGNFILFHGNLSVAENNEAAKWLIQHVFSKISSRVIIAGLQPGEDLVKEIEKFDHIDLIANPTDPKMNELISTAHTHVLHTAQATGLKLKLLNVLFTGRHIICNQHMIEGSGVLVNSSINIANTAQEMISKIEEVRSLSFTEALITARKEITQPFNNQINAQKLVNLLPQN
ncbi:MAG: glycosyltransferase family 1 protein [Bacteroidota bacterium]|nr:glycosyltransferase family 1 protein [Bacteroidota bacterium]